MVYWENPEVINKMEKVSITKNREIKHNGEIIVACHTQRLTDFEFAARKKVKDWGKNGVTLKMVF